MINAFDLIRRPPGNGLCFFAQYFFLGSGSQPPLNGSRQNWRISLKCTVLLTIKNNWGRCRSHHIVPFVQKNCWTYDQKKIVKSICYLPANFFNLPNIYLDWACWGANDHCAVRYLCHCIYDVQTHLHRCGVGYCISFY